MADYPFHTDGLDSEEIESFNETYKALKMKFDIEHTDHFHFQAQRFDLFRNYLSVYVRGCYVIRQNNSSNILFLQTEAPPLGKGKVGVGPYYQAWAMVELKQDFGRVLIRRETLTDKVIELLHPVELDFSDDKAFSDSFYVIVNDELKAMNAMTQNFRNAIMNIKEGDFIIEIVERTLIIGNLRHITPDHTMYLAEFVATVAGLR